MTQFNNLSPREQTIPWGECVGDGQYVETFRHIDDGTATPEMLQIGRAACAACPQVCALFRSEIGTQMYDIGQEDTFFIAGEEVTPPPNDTRPTILPAPVDFNLNRLPSNPKLAASFIRQSVRLHPFGEGVQGTRARDSIDDVAFSYRAQLPEIDEQLFTQLLAPPHMKPRAVERGLQKAVRILFQIADYDNFVAKRRNPNRYSLDVVEPTWDDIISIFMRGMVELDAQGFNEPDTKTFYLSPEDHMRIREYYRRTYGMSKTAFNNAIDGNPANPEERIRTNKMRLTLLMDTLGPSVAQPSTVAQRAGWSLGDSPEDRIPAINPKLSIKRLAAADIKALVAEANATGHIPNPDSPGGVAVALMQEFGNDPAFTPAVIATLAHLPLPEAARRCSERQTYINVILSNLGDNADIAPYFIRNFIARRGCKPIEEIRQHWLARRFFDHFDDRSHRDGVKNPIPTWAIWRILALEHNEAKAEEVGWQMYELTAQRLLTVGLSEPDVLQDMHFLPAVASVCEPRTGRYMTFSPVFNQLTQVDRLAFACHFGLSKMLYGHDLDSEQVAAVFELNDLSEYVLSEILPKCQALLGQDEPGLPPTLAQLSDDIRFLQALQDTDQPELIPFQQSLQTVIGGEITTLGPEGIELAELETKMRTWLRQLIYERCKPDHLAMGIVVEQAILRGALEVTGDAETGYAIDFAADWRRNYSEPEIAAAAQVLGIDRFMYGQDLSDLLKERLELDIEIIAQPLLDTPTEGITRDPTPEIPDLERTYFGKIGRAQATWLMRGLTENSTVHDQSFSSRASHLKDALMRGDFTVLETDEGYILHIPDEVLSRSWLSATRRLVEACGVMHMLSAAARQQLATRAETYERQRRRQAEDRRIELGIAILLDIYIHGFTTNRRSQISRLTTAHLSHVGANSLHKDDWAEQAMTTLFAKIARDYEGYTRASQSSNELARQTLGLHTPPRSIKEALDGLSEHTRAEKYQLYRQYLLHLANFAGWLRTPS